jgi:hypothetical protein
MSTGAGAGLTIPDVYLIGAPKAGTTSLSRWMASHPDLYFSQPKEPAYWATDYPRVREIRGFDTRAAYEQLYAGPEARSSTHLADGSTVYLYSREAVPGIVAEVGDAARFVVALRNPADLVVSFHRTQQLLLNEDEPDFETAWHRSLAGGLPGTDLLDPKLVDYSMVGSLGQAVSRVLDVVDRSRVHFIRFENLRDRPEQVWRDLTSFLSLSQELLPSFEVHNPSNRTFRSPTLHRLRNRPPAFLAGSVRRLRHLSLRSRRFKQLRNSLWWREQPKPQVSAEMRAVLTAHFASDVALLGEMIDEDLSDWTGAQGAQAR